MEGYMERYGKSFRVEHLKARWRQMIALLTHSSRGSCGRHWGISELPGAAGSLVLTFHLHCGVKCSSARALSAPTSSVVTSPLREHWLPKFPALGHSCRKGSSENPHQGPHYYVGKNFWASTLTPDFELCYSYALYLQKLNYWPHFMVWPQT